MADAIVLVKGAAAALGTCVRAISATAGVSLRMLSATSRTFLVLTLTYLLVAEYSICIMSSPLFAWSLAHDRGMSASVQILPGGARPWLPTQISLYAFSRCALQTGVPQNPAEFGSPATMF